MIKPLLSALALAAGLALPAPASAQNGEKVLVIYGNDRCPTTKAGEEVTVCARRPESDRYRIPSELRSGPLSTADQPWAARAGSVASVGGEMGSTTCSNVGGGGGSSCFANQMRQAHDEKAATKAAQSASPQPR